MPEERALNGETVQISSEQLSQIKQFHGVPERMEQEHRENYDGRQKLPGTLIRKKTVREKTIRKNRCQLRGESRLNLTDRRQNTGNGTRRMTRRIRILSGFWQVQVLLLPLWW